MTMVLVVVQALVPETTVEDLQLMVSDIDRKEDPKHPIKPEAVRACDTLHALLEGALGVDYDIVFDVMADLEPREELNERAREMEDVRQIRQDQATEVPT